VRGRDEPRVSATRPAPHLHLLGAGVYTASAQRRGLSSTRRVHRRLCPSRQMGMRYLVFLVSSNIATLHNHYQQAQWACGLASSPEPRHRFGNCGPSVNHRSLLQSPFSLHKVGWWRDCARRVPPSLVFGHVGVAEHMCASQGLRNRYARCYRTSVGVAPQQLPHRDSAEGLKHHHGVCPVHRNVGEIALVHTHAAEFEVERSKHQTALLD